MADRKLSPFEGLDVLRSAIEIPNAAGGLRDALDVEPVEFHHGDEGYIVLHWRTRKVRFDPIKDLDALSRVHVLDADEAVFVDGDDIADVFDRQRERVRELKAKAEANGQQTISDELAAQHGDGDHADGLVDGCPKCDAERDAEADEADTGGEAA